MNTKATEMTIPQLVHQAAKLADRTIAVRQEQDRAMGLALVSEAVRNSLLIAEKSKLSDEESEHAAIAVWLYFTALQRGALFNPEQGEQQPAEALLSELDIPIDYRQKIRRAVSAVLSGEPATLFEEVVCDGVNSIILEADQLTDFSSKELLLQRMISGSRIGWLRLLQKQLNQLRFFTPYARGQMDARRNKLLEKLNVYQQAIKKEYRETLMRAFNLSKKDIKKLKKLSKRDDRGIQTLFRLTSRNHFTLNAMVDRKANIMISINSIILSVMIGGLVGGLSGAWDVHLLPVMTLVLTSALSIIFAVISIRPEVSHGVFTREELEAKKGNLLFYGNFLKMPLKDYEREMLLLLNDANYLYLSMIRDIYYLGETLNKKNRLLRVSLNIFMVGIIVAVLLFGWTELRP